jgi:sensor histidine kinase YesM
MFSKESVEKITIFQKGYTKLLTFIDNSFAKKDNKPIILSKGLYPNSFFYFSSKEYHILNTCNVWTAEALKSAEVDVSAFFTLTTDDLFSQIRELEKK